MDVLRTGPANSANPRCEYFALEFDCPRAACPSTRCDLEHGNACSRIRWLVDAGLTHFLGLHECGAVARRQGLVEDRIEGLIARHRGGEA
jgi:hypothetical protein